MRAGTIRIVDKEFVIDCPPHVAIKLRRVFGGVQRLAAGAFRISANPATAYELAWFRERHPLELVGCERAFRKLVKAEKRRLASIEEVEQTDYVPREFDLAIPPREYQRIAADLALRTGSLLIADELGLGKQQPVDALVMTPMGYTPIGVLRVGDVVTGSDGQPIEVTGVFPQGIKPSYRVHLSDGASVEAGPDHLWTVAYFAGGRVLRRIVVSTEQIRTGAKVPLAWANGRSTLLDLSRTGPYVPMLSAPVEFADPAVLPIPPYLLGQLIANGGLAHGTPALVTHSADWEEIAHQITASGGAIGSVRVRGNVTTAVIPGCVADVHKLGLSVVSAQKFIPPIYLRASVRDRIALLHGLMDGDGSVSKERSRVSYHTTSRSLAGDVRILVEGLGGTAALSVYDRQSEGKPTEYRLNVRLPSSIQPFTVTRKAARYKPRSRLEPTRRIERIEYVRDVESVCIAVAAADRLYATEHCILTHNTVSSICALTAPGALPALVVTMTHLPRQWERELARFAPALRVHRIRKGQPYDLSKPRFETDHAGVRRRVAGMPDILIINYSKLGGWADTLADLVKTVIFDEAQELRHSGTNKYVAASAIGGATALRIGLSATPIYNYGAEIYSVLDVIGPGCLGTRKEFYDEWCGGANPGSDQDARKVCVADPVALGTYLRESGLMIRRTRKEVGRELPALTVVRHAVEVDAARINEAVADVAELARRVLDRTGSNFEMMKWSGEIDYRMRQATGIGKAPAVIDFVRLLVDAGERVVLYGWHHECYALWRSALDKHGITYAMYTGAESESAKAESVRRFCAEPSAPDHAQVLIISLRSGAGLDGLQHVCRTVVIGELDWSPKVLEQDIGRVHRDGQREPVMAYYLVADEGSDPVIADVLGLKEAQATGIIDPTRAGVPVLVGAADDHIRKLAEDVLRRSSARGAAAATEEAA